MKSLTAIVTAAAAALMTVTTAQAGLVNYSWDQSATEAAVGDTVTLTLWAEIDPEQDPFYALASSDFDIVVLDAPAGGTIGNPALAPAFTAGSLGTVGPVGISGVSAAQLPGFINPAIDTGTSLELYSFDYTIDDAAPRMIIVDLAAVTTNIYTGPTPMDPVIDYGALTMPAFIEVTSVPGPGSLALLGLAGFVGRRRRK